MAVQQLGVAPSGTTDAATKGYVDTAVTGLAPLASPTFTGTPTAPTATAGTNTTQIATTAFVAAVPHVADVSIVAFGAATTRVTGTGDFPFGVKLQRATTFTSVTFRVATADASGNLVVGLYKNGSAVSGTSTTIAAASQVAGGTSTGSWSFSSGDILTVQITAVGTTPGNGLIADITGAA